MNDERRAPADLGEIIKGSIPPGASVETDWLDFEHDEWRFRLTFFGRMYLLHVSRENYEDRRVELISLLASLGAPAPEATVGGKRFWIRLVGRMPDGDAVKYMFERLWHPRDAAEALSVTVTRTAGGMLPARARRRDHDAFELAMSLWVLKDGIDNTAAVTAYSVDSTNLEKFISRERTLDPDVRGYVSARLYQAYQAGGKDVALRFSWVDFEYLGITEDEFSRAVSLRDSEDWVVNGLLVAPTKNLIERCDAAAAAMQTRAGRRSEASPETRRDLFVSYASEDKDAFVRPLVEALTAAGVTVWFDEYELVLGDSLRRKIDEGLRNSKHGLVVLSHSFFGKEWPQKELDGLFALMDQDRRIMPIWHGLTKADVTGYAPTLAGIVGIKSSEGIGHIVRAVDRALGREGGVLSPPAPRTGFTASGQTESRPVQGGSAGAQDWRRELRVLAERGATILVHPIVPAAFAADVFQIGPIEDTRVGLRKQDSGHWIDIPPYQIIGVRKSFDAYVLDIHGRIQWTDAHDSWQYMPEGVDPRDPNGVARDVDSHSPEVRGLEQKLRAAGWTTGFVRRVKARRMLTKKYQLVYGHDGRYLWVPDWVGVTVMVKHRKA